MQILNELYLSEINFSIESFWHGGFHVRLGDGYNGYKDEANMETLEDAEEWLRSVAILHYPNSQFAERMRREE